MHFKVTSTDGFLCIGFFVGRYGIVKKSEPKKLLNLFFTFLKIGTFTFGGGYAMIPLIQAEVAEKNKWISDKDILDIVAVAESTPGPIAINCATFIGYKVCGFIGAALATLAVVLPSFIIISLIALVLRRFQDIKIVKYAFFGVRAGVLALIVKAFTSMYRQCPKNVVSYIAAAAAFICVCIFDINVIIVIAGCAAFGIITAAVAKRKNRL